MKTPGMGFLARKFLQEGRSAEEFFRAARGNKKAPRRRGGDTMKPIDFEIFSEIVKAIEKVKGAEIELSSLASLFSQVAEMVAAKYDYSKRLTNDEFLDLLSVLGSFGDTLPDEEVLGLLKEWNTKGQIFTKILAKAESPNGL